MAFANGNGNGGFDAGGGAAGAQAGADVGGGGGMAGGGMNGARGEGGMNIDRPLAPATPMQPTAPAGAAPTTPTPPDPFQQLINMIIRSYLGDSLGQFFGGGAGGMGGAQSGFFPGMTQLPTTGFNAPNPGPAQGTGWQALLNAWLNPTTTMPNAPAAPGMPQQTQNAQGPAGTQNAYQQWFGSLLNPGSTGIQSGIQLF